MKRDIYLIQTTTKLTAKIPCPQTNLKQNLRTAPHKYLDTIHSNENSKPSK